MRWALLVGASSRNDFRVTREKGGKVLMHLEIRPFRLPSDRQVHKPFLKYGEKDIVRLRAGPREFVVNEGETIFARHRETVINPALDHIFLCLEYP